VLAENVVLGMVLLGCMRQRASDSQVGDLSLQSVWLARDGLDLSFQQGD
jgi:hypothetical protein